MTATVALGIAGLVMLYFGGDFLVRGASGIAFRFGLSPLAVGLTVVAFGTSVPELLVSIDAALAGSNGISVGNVVGSNIANIALILGMAALIRPMNVESKVLGVDVPIMIGATLAFLLMMVGGFVNRIEGVLLFAGLILYVWLTVHLARKESEEPEGQADAIPAARSGTVPALSAYVAGGLVLLFVGADFLVDSAVALAKGMNISEATIGLTIVAVGTSLPEFATTVVACIKRQGEIALGNIVGSNTFNILCVLGITAVVHPLERGRLLYLDLGLMTGLALLLGALLLHRLYIGRALGGVLVVVYVGYIAWRLI